MQENLFTPNCIRTRHGKYVNILEPTPDMFIIEDVAYALNKIPRFSGHLKFDYTVLMHSINACLLTAGDKFEALMHDCTEAYIGDLSSPIKQLVPEYQRIETNLRKVMAQAFGFNPEFSQQTHDVDRLLLQMEWDQMMIGNDPSLKQKACMSSSILPFQYHFLNLYNKHKPQ